MLVLKWTSNAVRDLHVHILDLNISKLSRFWRKNGERERETEREVNYLSGVAKHPLKVFGAGRQPLED
jgi:hypothetical protein